MSHDETTVREVVVHGRVQGVFFRDSCRREAARHGVHGWVRNEPDGSVRAHLQGPAEAVERLLAWMHEGPPRAAVEGVEVRVAPPAPVRGFEVR